MKENLVSVIVPVYNVEQYLQRCIDSICEQTYQNLEIFLVDDGSQDSSGKICDQAACKDSRIQVIHQHNQGISAARNAGLDLAHGTYLSFIDSDDIYEKHFVEEMVYACQQYDAEIAVAQFKKFEEEICDFDIKNEKSTQVFTGPEAVRNLVGTQHIRYTLVSNKIYHKTVFENKRFVVGKIHEDEDIMYRILYTAKKVVDLDMALYGYFSRENSIMTSEYSKKRLDYLPIAKERAEFFQKNGEKELHHLFLWVYAFALLQHYPRVKKDLEMPQVAAQLKQEYRRIAPQLIQSPYLSRKKRMMVRLFRIIPGAYAEIMRKKVKYLDAKNG